MPSRCHARPRPRRRGQLREAREDRCLSPVYPGARVTDEAVKGNETTTALILQDEVPEVRSPCPVDWIEPYFTMNVIVALWDGTPLNGVAVSNMVYVPFASKLQVSVETTELPAPRVGWGG